MSLHSGRVIGFFTKVTACWTALSYNALHVVNGLEMNQYTVEYWCIFLAAINMWLGPAQPQTRRPCHMSGAIPSRRGGLHWLDERGYRLETVDRHWFEAEFSCGSRREEFNV